MATQQDTRWTEPQQDTVEPEWNDPQRRLQHQVEIQSRRLEQLLSQHDVPADVSGGSVRPHWVSFDLVTHLSGGWERLRRISGELAGALGVPEVRLEREQGKLRLAVKRYDPHPVDLLDLLDMVPEAGDLSLALGLDHQGRPVMLNLAQNDLHNVLVAGISGAGKSSLMRSLAISLALTCRQSLAQLAVVGVGSAPSGIATRPNPLYPVNYLPHLLFPVATTLDEAIEALAYLAQEAEYRADNAISSPVMIIVVDDADMLLRRAGPAAADNLAALLHAPAEAGLRVIVGAGNPGLPDLLAMLKHNVDLRLVGRMEDERAARAAAGRDDSYAQYLEGRGDFLAISAAGIVPFQAAYIDDYDLHLTLSELHRASEPVLLARTMGDRPDLPPSWALSDSVGFTYDGVSAQATMEGDDRSGLDTLEIMLDPTRDDPSRSTPLSWLDGPDQPAVEPPTVDGPLPGSPPEPLPPASRPELASDLDRESPAAGLSVEEILIAEVQAAVEVSSGPDATAIDGYQPAAVPAPVEVEANEAPDPPVADEPAGERPYDIYQMLPFEEEPVGDNVEPAKPAGAIVTESFGRVEPEEIHMAAPQRSMTDAAQALWPVDPIYTDIDDDLWEKPEGDEDDWRRRLH